MALFFLLIKVSMMPTIIRFLQQEFVIASKTVKVTLVTVYDSSLSNFDSYACNYKFLL